MGYVYRGIACVGKHVDHKGERMFKGGNQRWPCQERRSLGALTSGERLAAPNGPVAGPSAGKVHLQRVIITKAHLEEGLREGGGTKRGF